MAEVITNAGERLIAEKQGNGKPLIIDRVILSHDPAIDPSAAINRNTGMPAQETITYQARVTRAAWVTPNEVVYSLFLGTEIGPFKFNRMDLVASSDNINVAISTLPAQQKIADNPSQDIRGQNMTRNMVLVFDGARAITQITIEAEAWQWDFDQATEKVAGLARLASMDEVLVGVEQEKIVTPMTLAYALNRTVFPGFIGMFAGTENQISIGWQLCNGIGKTSNGIAIPDLRDRMIICSGGKYNTDSQGGSEYVNTTQSGNHDHAINISGHTLTISEIPSHYHSVGWNNYPADKYQYGQGSKETKNDRKDYQTIEHYGSTSNTGGSRSHNHSGSVNYSGSHDHIVNTLSPYYALAMIIKL